MGRGTSQGTSTNPGMGTSQAQGQVQDMRNPQGGMGNPHAGTSMGLPQMGPRQFSPGPQATMPGPGGGVASQPWGDIDWMQLREQFQQGQQPGGGSGWMEAMKNRHNRSGQPHMNGMTQAMSQARAFSPSGHAENSQVGYRPQGGNPVTTAGSVAGTQQAPTSSVETGVTPQANIAGAQPAPSGPPPAAPSGVAPTPANPGVGGANAQALIQALRARGG